MDTNGFEQRDERDERDEDGSRAGADRTLGMSQMQLSDALTGLAGRAALDALDDEAAHGGPNSVILVDLDAFKAVNDTYGHRCGDRVLRVIAERLRSAAPTALSARLGADEFAIVVSSADRAACEDLATVVYDAIREPLRIDETTLFLDAGVGVALADGELTVWELVSRAGAAIRSLKRSGRLPRVVVFEDAIHGEVLDTLALSLDLRAALRRDQLQLHYQPLVDMTTRRALGFEALLRWAHPVRGAIGPDRFVPLAEGAGLMSELGEWVLARACRDANRWKGANGRPPFVSVNVSIRQLEDPDFIRRYLRTLDSSELEPRRLKLEVTETAVAGEIDAIAPVLETLRGAGIGVLLDDFGTGYSSLGYIRDLPLDGVKLDRMFTRDLTVSADAWSLTRAAVTMINQLGLEMIAEGLESPAHLAQLRSLGCNIGQGYYFARPRPTGALQFSQLGKSGR